MGINDIGAGNVIVEQLTKSIITEAKKGKITTLINVIKSSNKELPPEAVKSLLASKAGTKALVNAFKGEEDKAVFLMDTIDNIDDRGYFLETVLFELASIIKNSENTSGKQKIDGIKSTIEGIHTFLFSALSNLSTEKILEVVNFLGKDIIFSLLRESIITINEDIELDEEDFYGDDENRIEMKMSALDKIESGVVIPFNEINISGKYSVQVSDLLETLFDNDDSLYTEILEEKVLSQDNYEPYIVKSEELQLKEVESKKDSVYMLIKARIEGYERNYSDKRFEIDPEEVGILLENKTTKGVKSKKVENTVGITGKEVDKIVKEEESEGVYNDF